MRLALEWGAPHGKTEERIRGSGRQWRLGLVVGAGALGDLALHALHQHYQLPGFMISFRLLAHPLEVLWGQTYATGHRGYDPLEQKRCLLRRHSLPYSGRLANSKRNKSNNDVVPGFPQKSGDYLAGFCAPFFCTQGCWGLSRPARDSGIPYRSRQKAVPTKCRCPALSRAADGKAPAPPK
jgi:hypothetical protein